MALSIWPVRRKPHSLGHFVRCQRVEAEFEGQGSGIVEGQKGAGCISAGEMQARRQEISRHYFVNKAKVADHRQIIADELTGGDEITAVIKDLGQRQRGQCRQGRVGAGKVDGLADPVFESALGSVALARCKTM